MSVNDFMEKYQSSFQNKPLINPLSSSNNGGIKRMSLGINKPKTPSLTPKPISSSQDNVYGNAVSDYLGQKKRALDSQYVQRKTANTNELAADVVEKSAGNIPMNSWGVVPNKLSNFSDMFNKQLKQVSEYGQISLQREEAKAQWQGLQRAKEMNAGIIANIAPGASIGAISGKGGVGAKAVAMALNVQKSGTPYKWGGNSLTGGVDCSGLVQQIYSRLGVSLPRTTYEQAKKGRAVSIGSLVPGDLVFYNTGSRDPNGIGNLSHVAIYIGNGKVVHAYNTKTGIVVDSINRAGKPALGIRPW